MMNENILMVLHSNYMKNNAGVEKVVLEQEQIFLNQGLNCIVVFPIIKVKVISKHHIYIKTGKYCIVENKEILGEYNFKDLIKVLESKKFKATIIHHLKCHKHINSLFKKINTVSEKLYYYIHDYSTICDNHRLLRNNKVYCGNDGLKWNKCRTCRFYFKGSKQYKLYKKIFSTYKRMNFIFPSQYVMNIWINVYGESYRKRCEVISNQIFSEFENIITAKNNIKIRVAYIGYQNPIKGWEMFKKFSQINNSLFDFYVLGSCTEEIPGVKVIPVSFIDQGPNAMVEAIKRNNIDIAFLWSTCPETYGYTFYESYISGTYIITSKLSGNIAYMVEKMACGKVFEDEKSMMEFFENEKNVKNILNNYFKEGIIRPKELLTNNRILELIHEERGYT